MHYSSLSGEFGSVYSWRSVSIYAPLEVVSCSLIQSFDIEPQPCSVVMMYIVINCLMLSYFYRRLIISDHGLSVHK